MRRELEKGGEIFAITMDIKNFYHSISPAFLTRSLYLKTIGISLDANEMKFTRDLIDAIGGWYASTSDYKERPAGALPVGLSSSKIMANSVLVDLDRLVGEKLRPLYYGRYVDDVFLVIKAVDGISDGITFMRWLAQQLAPSVKFKQEGEKFCLKYEPKFALDSEIIFSGDKQKIFHLKGKYGLDLISQISEQIKKQSSEHRLLPIIPRSESEMLSQALLATPDSSLEADALRKADVVSVRRLGFSLLLRDVEGYARDLRPKEWRDIRHQFYGLVERHVLTPKGYFEYFSYIARVFGLMVSCGDMKAASSFIKRFNYLCGVLRKTTTCGTKDKEKFESSIAYYVKALTQVAFQSSTVKSFTWKGFISVAKELRKIDKGVPVTLSKIAVRQVSRDLLVSDLGRRPYREYWIKENKLERNIPARPKLHSINRVLRLDLIRNFRINIDRDQNAPYWPAVVFPTRPLSFAEITAMAPDMLAREGALKDALFALRGARVGSGVSPFVVQSESPAKTYIYVPPATSKDDDSYGVAVTSYQTKEVQWKDALNGRPDRTLVRYEGFRRQVNAILRSAAKVDYVAFPELSVPRRWAFGAAIKFCHNGISLICGLENNNQGGMYRNDALVSLVTRWPGYRTHVQLVQPKIAPAHHEFVALEEKGVEFYIGGMASARPVYIHGNHAFGVVICSDLTSIENRGYFQGEVDTLFVVEWNQDINTFSYLVESASHDLHSFIVQSNNRAYGDSRIRAPYVKDFKRDVVRVKGGREDYFVVGEINVRDLRGFHISFDPISYEKNKGDQIFKPLPIGFVVSSARGGAGV